MLLVCSHEVVGQRPDQFLNSVRLGRTSLGPTVKPCDRKCLATGMCEA